MVEDLLDSYLDFSRNAGLPGRTRH